MSFSKERKRTRGDIACAECRRLKTRCNKRVPCSTCLKRGCDMLCPNSTMPPGEGSRFIDAAEEFLRRKITKMEERMHLLEDALVITQGGSCKPYPLLNGESFSGRVVEWAPDVNQDPTITMNNEFNKYGLADVFGSLYLGSEGSSADGLALLGTSGSSENFNAVQSLLLQAKAYLVEEGSSSASHAEEIDLSYLPPDINMFHQAFPFTPSGIPMKPVQDLIESFLPSFPRATALSEMFLQSMSWIFNIVSRQHILGELIPVVYRHASEQIPAQPRSYGSHDLALLFIVLALGTLVDPSLPPYNIEGQHYHVLSRAALCLQPVLAQHSVVTIKALSLMSVYNGMCGIESKLEHSVSLLNLAAHVALQIGFHKDPSIWGITGREAYERRTYFWNLLNGTLWQSLVTGGPPVIIPSMIDCHIPTEEEEDMYQTGEASLGFGSWSFSFVIQCLVPVVEVTQGARPPSYDTVLALDRKIRDFSLPQASSNTQTSEQMQTLVKSQLREITLLFLHRGFFAQALMDSPWDPLQSPHQQSFLTAYQSATKVLSTTSKQFAHQPVLCARIWRIWSFAFSAAVIVATVSIKQLSINLEPEPFGQLDLACTLFHKAARTSVRAQKALPILLRLRREATQVRLEILQSEYGNAGSEEVRYDHERSVGSSRLFTYQSTSNTSRLGVSSPPSSKCTQALPVSIIHTPRARITESDEEPYESIAGARLHLELQGIYGEISSSTSPASHGSPSACYGTHPTADSNALEDPWTSFMLRHPGTSAHSHQP